MIAATPAEQRRLHDLQQIDLEIRKLQHRRANLPEQKSLDENQDTLSRVGADLAQHTERLEHLERQQKRTEDELSTVDARRKTEEGRMYSGQIHNERELGAIKAELSSLKARKNELEDRLLDTMEEREETESLVEALRERHRELREQASTLAVARDEAARDIDAELAQQRTAREAVQADIPPDIVAYYEELRARKDGVGVAELRGKACQGCRLELTAIELEELREQAPKGLSKCPQCGRILVLPA